jgi:hypothetical protein
MPDDLSTNVCPKCRETSEASAEHAGQKTRGLVLPEVRVF